ncbi:uncharacterized protein C9orf57 homolog [Phacochoerus africanus]|uniref:uncharacterized protein C9orf57 homolog n=1 Tax=Phacochoerus africanus TaxID=41426 RepID=UPI001FD963A2|nr:uncharacterized protein C9orf57 homolog [Phacochoerus africanus]
MRSTVFSGAFLLFCLLGDGHIQAPSWGLSLSNEMEKMYIQGVGGVICRACNLSIPFHGCLLDFGTCRTKPGQYCMKETHSKNGIQWYSVKGCTESKKECFQRTVTPNEVHSTHCCYRTMCNF